MEPVYVETTINDRLIRINKNDSMDVWYWRDWIKTPNWVKSKIQLSIDKKSGYKKYKLKLNKKHYILSRVVYKAYNPDWDISDTGYNNLIDHINNNSLDNRIENLRILTKKQNQWNTNAKGYTWHKYNKKWSAQLMVSGKYKFIGYFTEESDARNAYLEAKEKYHIIA